MLKRITLLCLLLTASVLVFFGGVFLGRIELILLSHFVAGVMGSSLITAKRLWPYTKQAFLLAALHNLITAVLLDRLTLDGQSRFGELSGIVFITGLPVTLGILYAVMVVKRVIERTQRPTRVN